MTLQFKAKKLWREVGSSSCHEMDGCMVLGRHMEIAS